MILAASSTLAKQLQKLCKSKGIETINIVRRDEHIQILNDEIGSSKYVFNQNHADFYTKLETAIGDLNPSLIFECLGGDIPGKILERMPPLSEMIVYGDFSHTPLVINNNVFLFK